MLTLVTLPSFNIQTLRVFATSRIPRSYSGAIYGDDASSAQPGRELFVGD
jgi:hypothetical protein